ncbi:MAG: hypothetical protein UY22_C0051G0019 [Candidatus Amesbacteria bacterium GW2011_GWC1_48_10]|uniref:Transcriptional regulator, Crp/Fnr family n=1 Tax=Candidatus Amesbacteria bacterium GW2011_GWC1_48_10 TaxID=1618365 RepID=A0A0G1U9A7_9BACT|nr:MAG: hypothetical protein UY22_C0051G0019 [Candidatus Amesbacteria bacterium GW2011_GWC1_48_10]
MLPAAKLKQFFSQFKPLTFKAQDPIIRASDTPAGIYFVKSGFVKMNSSFADGRQVTLNIFKPGSYFPMLWAVADIPNVYSYTAMTDVSAARMGRDQLLDFLDKNPDILMDFTRRILVGLHGLITNIEHLLSGDSYHRVIAALILCAKRFCQNRGKKIVIDLPLTHQDIADLAAITRETASLAMGKLTRKGLISRAGRNILILDPVKLSAESGIEALSTPLPPAF